MAVQGGPNWSTKDYFDPWPGIQMGMARRQQADQRERNKVSDARAEEDQKMQQAEMLARMGVPPVQAPGGGIDWNATAQAAQMKQEMGKQAQALATYHAWTGGPTSLTQEEDALRQLPEYQQTYRMVGAMKAQKEAERIAVMEQIGARGQAALKVAEQRGENVSKPQATMTRKLPDGTTVRVPMSPEEAMKMGQPEGGATAPGDKWQEAIDAILRFKDAGESIDVTTDSEGFPKVTKAGKMDFWNTADPSNKKGYDDEIEKIMKRSGKKEGPKSGGGRPMIVIPR